MQHLHLIGVAALTVGLTATTANAAPLGTPLLAAKEQHAGVEKAQYYGYSPYYGYSDGYYSYGYAPRVYGYAYRPYRSNYYGYYPRWYGYRSPFYRYDHGIRHERSPN